MTTWRADRFWNSGINSFSGWHLPVVPRDPERRTQSLKAVLPEIYAVTVLLIMTTENYIDQLIMFTFLIFLTPLFASTPRWLLHRS